MSEAIQHGIAPSRGQTCYRNECWVIHSGDVINTVFIRPRRSAGVPTLYASREAKVSGPDEGFSLSVTCIFLSNVRGRVSYHFSEKSILWRDSETGRVAQNCVRTHSEPAALSFSPVTLRQQSAAASAAGETLLTCSYPARHGWEIDFSQISRRK